MKCREKRNSVTHLVGLSELESVFDRRWGWALVSRNKKDELPFERSSNAIDFRWSFSRDDDNQERKLVALPTINAVHIISSHTEGALSKDELVTRPTVTDASRPSQLRFPDGWRTWERASVRVLLKINSGSPIILSFFSTPVLCMEVLLFVTNLFDWYCAGHRITFLRDVCHPSVIRIRPSSEIKLLDAIDAGYLAINNTPPYGGPSVPTVHWWNED
jgi:hypothetical protein